MGLISEVQFVQKVQIVQNVLNGLNGLNVLNQHGHLRLLLAQGSIGLTAEFGFITDGRSRSARVKRVDKTRDLELLQK
jgi:hypothetical protein